jgi:hypothetical protein
MARFMNNDFTILILPDKSVVDPTDPAGMIEPFTFCRAMQRAGLAEENDHFQAVHRRVLNRNVGDESPDPADSKLRDASTAVLGGGTERCCRLRCRPSRRGSRTIFPDAGEHSTAENLNRKRSLLTFQGSCPPILKSRDLSRTRANSAYQKSAARAAVIFFLYAVHGVGSICFTPDRFDVSFGFPILSSRVSQVSKQRARRHSLFIFIQRVDHGTSTALENYNRQIR